ncbi:MAG: TonB-dependent receptor domain-containing protein [Bryobacteraceae bacterium]
MGFAFAVDNIEKQSVDRYRVGPEHHLFGVNRKRFSLENGPPCQTARMPSMICSTVLARSSSTVARVPINEYPSASGTAAIAYRSLESGVFRPRYQDVGLYIQDDYRVNSQVVLNLGLRWEFRKPVYDVANGGTVFDTSYPGGRILYEDKNFTQIFNNPILAGCCAPNPIVPSNYKNFAPRVGLAWRPFPGSNKFVVRSGYGIFYDVFQNYFEAQQLTENVSFVSPALPIPTGFEATPPLNIRNLFPAPLSIAGRNFPAPYCQAPAVSVVNPVGLASTNNLCPGAGGVQGFRTTPYDQQWGINLQFEPVKGLLLESGYQGAHGVHLPGYFFANPAVLPPTAGNPNNGLQYLSQCPPGTYPATCSPIQTRVPYRNFAASSQTVANLPDVVVSRLQPESDSKVVAWFAGAGGLYMEQVN